MRKVAKQKVPTLTDEVVAFMRILKPDVAFMRILKEVPEEWIRMDIEMSDPLINTLLTYADQTMNEEERKTLYINWAFIDIIKKQIKAEQQKNKRKKVNCCCG